VPAPDITSRDPGDEVTPPPPAPFRGGTGTPLATIHEDKKLTTSARNWLMGKRSEGGEEAGEGSGEGREDVKTATGSEPPRGPQGPRGPEDGKELMGEWSLPSAGVGERMDNHGVMRVAPEIEDAMRNTPAPAVYLRRIVVPDEEDEDEIDPDPVARARDIEWWEGVTRMLNEESRSRHRRRRRRRGGSGGGGGGGPNGAPGEEEYEWVEDGPEEANEYTPSGAAPAEMVAESMARARGRAMSARRRAERAEAVAREEAEAREEEAGIAAAAAAAMAEAARREEATAREEAASRVEAAAREAAAVLAAARPPLDATTSEAARKLQAAERARAAVENEPHSPSWNGSTYIDGREHHYCGPDFPCQMEPVCEPSIKEIWEKGLPVPPEEMPPPKRSSFTGPMRALFGFKKGAAEQKRKPVSIESIRVGNSAETKVIAEPRSATPPGSGRKASSARGEAERGDCKTMRGLKKVWGFWTYFGGKMGVRRGVVVTKSDESLPVVQGVDDTDVVRCDPAEADAASTAPTKLVASACYPVGESTVETAKVVKRTDSGTEIIEGTERRKN
jgi:hypothetical protein